MIEIYTTTENIKIGETREISAYRHARVGCGFDRAGKVRIKVASITKVPKIAGISATFFKVIGEEVAA
jgi:hypothetical protein